MPKRSDDDERMLPFPVAPVSNGEWCPLPITDKAAARREAHHRGDEGGREAARHDAREVPAHRGGHDDRVRGAEQGERTRSVGRGVRAADEEGSLRRPRCRTRAARQERHVHHRRSAAPCGPRRVRRQPTPSASSTSVPICIRASRARRASARGSTSRTFSSTAARPIGVLSGLPYGLPIGPHGHGRDARPGERARGLGALLVAGGVRPYRAARKRRPRSRRWSTR